MTVDNAIATTTAIDLKSRLASINARIVVVRTWMSHDHGDEPYWSARRTTAPKAQAERMVLRGLADLIHVERATARGRIHGTRFATIDDQRAWLAQRERTLAMLRDRALPI